MPPIECTKEVTQSVLTARSKTITGLPVSQARSTAAVVASGEYGEMMKPSQSPSFTK